MRGVTGRAKKTCRDSPPWLYVGKVNEQSLADLDLAAADLVRTYREAVRSGAAGESAYSAALSLGRALEAIGRARRSLHPETACDVAAADVAEARLAMSRLAASLPS